MNKRKAVKSPDKLSGEGTRDLLHDFCQAIAGLEQGQSTRRSGATLEQLLEKIYTALMQVYQVERGFIAAGDRLNRWVFHAQGEFSPWVHDSRHNAFLRLHQALGRATEMEPRAQAFAEHSNQVFYIRSRSFQAIEESAGDTLFMRGGRYVRLARAFASVLRKLADDGYVVLVPLVFAQEIWGYVALGDKRGGYSQSDLELLGVLRHFLALTLRNFVVIDQLQILKTRAESEARKLANLFVTSQAFQEPVGGGRIIHRSDIMMKLLREATVAAASDRATLIQGETGTGKELIARYIHENSKRRDEPFIAVNSAAIPENLWESEVFGHVAGAFTDGRSARGGYVQEAGDGTLFFDEIGDLAGSQQAKLLRLLQQNEFIPVGAGRPRGARCRFLFATNKDLSRLVSRGEFREDLYFRIAVFELEVPPLRRRRTDTPLLALFFVQQFAREFGCPVPRIDAEAFEALIAYDWPGNVREMENVLIRAVASATEGTITAVDLAEIIGGRRRKSGRVERPQISYQDYVDNQERTLLERTLAGTNGNKSRAAALLGISRQRLRYRLKLHGL